MKPSIPKFKVGDKIVIVKKPPSDHVYVDVYHKGHIATVVATVAGQYIFDGNGMRIADVKWIDDNCVLYDSPEGIWMRI